MAWLKPRSWIEPTCNAPTTSFTLGVGLGVIVEGGVGDGSPPSAGLGANRPGLAKMVVALITSNTRRITSAAIMPVLLLRSRGVTLLMGACVVCVLSLVGVGGEKACSGMYGVVDDDEVGLDGMVNGGVLGVLVSAGKAGETGEVDCMRFDGSVLESSLLSTLLSAATNAETLG
jgi:hypothetical protein